MKGGWVIKENPKGTFGAYLRQLRQSRELTVRGVAKKTMEAAPDNKKAWISSAHLVHVEKGNSLPPSPEKLRSLAKIYGENYEFMLYKAGYLPQNPLKGPEDWTHKMLRDRYFENLTTSKKRRGLTEEEKNSVEKVVENVVMTITGGINR